MNNVKSIEVQKSVDIETIIMILVEAGRRDLAKRIVTHGVTVPFRTQNPERPIDDYVCRWNLFDTDRGLPIDPECGDDMMIDDGALNRSVEMAIWTVDTGTRP